MKRWLIALLMLIGGGAAAQAQRLPGLPGMRPGTQQPVRRDSTKDTTALVRWPTPDSVTQKLLDLKDYSITRYQGDTANFNAQTRALDLLANKQKKLKAVVQRDSQTVVSDSGIFYTESARRVITGGHYVLSDPSSGQADITGFYPQISFSLGQRSARISNAYLPVSNGEMWYMHVNTARVDIDSTAGHSPTAWIRGGSMTSCSDSIPDYQFVYKEAKRTSNNAIVARNVVMYVKDIPVAWFPFIFSDNRSGRHSGILPPQFGFGDIVRNSPTYRRNVDHVGYYWALSDYFDFATWLDWRSSAGGVATDPGWLRYNFDWNYKWLDRFMGGRIGLNYTTQADHRTNLGLSWSHSQDFSHDTHFTTSVNYVTSTDLQRQNTFNPYTALATIASAATYTTKLGPASLSLGATQKQYPGRKQVDRTFPTFSLTSTPVSVGKWLTWTPSFSFSENSTLGMDQPGPGSTKYEINALGKLDSTVNTNRSSYDATTTFDTPLQIFGWDFHNSFRIHQQRNNFPEQYQIYDVNTGDVIANRVFASTYKTEVDWNPQFTLPGVAQNKFNLTPSVGLSNVDPGPFWIASERTNGQYVHQAKRLNFGLSATPTLYHRFTFASFGPFEAIRHSITPSITYSYAPAADVGNDYLKAIGSTRKGYLGNLASNSVSFGLQQNFEAKVRPRTGGNDSATTTGSSDKIKLLSINFTPLTYDFERASVAKSRGLSAMRGITTDSWGYDLNSDLLPGFEFSANYSLFQGSALSDSAVFKPWLQTISASLNIGRDKNPFTLLSRLFGHPAPEPQKAPSPGVGVEGAKPAPDAAEQAQFAAQPVAGSVRGGDRFIVPTTAGWTANFAFSRSSPRPPVGANVIEYDPQVRCQQISQGEPFLLDACLAQARAQPTTDTPIPPTEAGGPAYKIPPTTSLQSNIAFNLTPKWSAHWTSTYDFEHHQFASHMVQLQRDLHDWRAMFGFTQSPNGNFAFNFTIALKADPDIKFDYNRATVRSGQTF